MHEFTQTKSIFTVINSFNLGYTIVHQTYTMINIILLILVVTYIVGLHAEYKNIISHNSFLTIQNLVDVLQTPQLLEMNLLRRLTGKAKILDYFSALAIRVT